MPSHTEMQSSTEPLNGSLWNGGDVAGEASQWNYTIKTLQDLQDIQIDANFAWLIFSLLIAMIWFTYSQYNFLEFICETFINCLIILEIL